MRFHESHDRYVIELERAVVSQLTFDYPLIVPVDALGGHLHLAIESPLSLSLTLADSARPRPVELPLPRDLQVGLEPLGAGLRGDVQRRPSPTAASPASRRRASGTGRA